MEWVNQIHIGHVWDILKKMPDELVHCVVTSPPYWGLRNYGLEPVVWDGKDGCDHQWGSEFVKKYAPKRDHNGANDFSESRGTESYRAGFETELKLGSFCPHCNAWRGQLGLEPTPELYVKHLVDIFREVKRVLRKDGTLWLNLGDSYAGSSQGWGKDKQYADGKQATNIGSLTYSPDHIYPKPPNYISSRQSNGLKPKDLCEIPSDVVKALRTDGWYLRSRIPWLKRNSMPESVTDRPATAVEYVFLLSKSEKYFYDGEAVKMGLSETTIADKRNSTGRHTQGKLESKYYEEESPDKATPDKPSWYRSKTFVNARAGRNLRNSDFFFQTWQGLLTDEEGEPLALIVNPKGYKGAHFATFPDMLVEPMIRAGTSERGCCPKCGSSWERIIEKTGGTIGKAWHDHDGDLTKGQSQKKDRTMSQAWEDNGYQVKTLGWQPTCECVIEPIPCTVLDPFLGSGTVTKVAIRLRRNWVGIDLSPEYGELAEKRKAWTQVELI